MTFTNRNIANAILANEKRVAKIKNLKDGRAQAIQYVVAECATQKVKLTKDEVIRLGCEIAMALERR